MGRDSCRRFGAHDCRRFNLRPEEHFTLTPGRVARGGCPPPALTEPYKCCSHTALRDDGLLPPPPVGSRPVDDTTSEQRSLSRVRHTAVRVDRPTPAAGFRLRDSCRSMTSRVPVATSWDTGCVHRAPLAGLSVLFDSIVARLSSISAADAFPPCLRSWDDLSATFRYWASVLDLRGHRPSSFRSPAYRFRGTQQISSGKTNRVHDHPVVTTHRTTNGIWASLLGASSPARKALRRFAFARNGHAPMASTRRALAGPPRTTDFGSTSDLDLVLQARALATLGVGFPPLGPRVWIFTSSLLVMPIAPPPG